MKKKCLEIVGQSEAGKTLDMFQKQIADALAQVEGAKNSNEINTATNALREKGVAFLKSEDAWPASGQRWNMTLLLANPDFNTDANGWSGDPVCNYGVAEHYNKNFDTYQTLTGLKNGVYIVEVNALYRTGVNDGGTAYKNGTENIPAMLYANEQTQKVASLYSYLYDGETAGFGGTDLKNGYVNSMYTASLCFAQNLYPNSLEVSVTDGTLKLGLKSQGRKNDCWCCFDNFRLLYSRTNTDNIKDILGDTQEVDVYTVSGVKVRNKMKSSEVLKGLPKGIYIINGKKVVYP